jgi:hypothetical protein
MLEMLAKNKRSSCSLAMTKRIFFIILTPGGDFSGRETRRKNFQKSGLSDMVKFNKAAFGHEWQIYCNSIGSNRKSYQPILTEMVFAS